MKDHSSINTHLAHIKVVAMDFDGIHTDGYVYMDQEGRESVRCSRRDSLGLGMLKEAGLKLFVISKETNPVVRARCAKLDIEFFQGVADAKGKEDILRSLAEREKVDPSQILFIGDDVNDIGALAYAGVAVTVADGHADVLSIADIVLTRNGGAHALRELCDMILAARAQN